MVTWEVKARVLVGMWREISQSRGLGPSKFPKFPTVGCLGVPRRSFGTSQDS